VIRFPTLAQQSFWTDEATTHGIVAHGLGHVLSTVPKTESTPPVYYVLLWLWSRVFGLGEAGLRSLSALCGTLTVAAVGVAGRRLIDERAGLIAALLTAVSPIMVWYSQEARAYALVILLSALTLIALHRALERPDRARLSTWGLVSAVALAVHYFAIFVIVPELGWLTIALRRRSQLTVARAAVAVAPIVVAGGALLPLLVHQDDGRAAFISQAQGSLAARVVRLVKQDILGFSEPSKAVFSVLAAGLVVLAGVLLLRRTDPEQLHRAWLPLAVGAGGVALAIAAAGAGADYIDTRNLLPTWPALALVAAAGLAAGRARRVGRLGVAAAAAVSIACVFAVVLTPLYQRANWRGVAHALGPAPSIRAIVGDRQSFTSLSPYVHGLAPTPPTGAGVGEVDVFALALQSSPPARPAAAPSLPGFTLVARKQTDTYTLLRYRSPLPIRESRAALLALGLNPGASNNSVLLERSANARHSSAPATTAATS
jgi:mannosyltransferase